MSYCRWSSDDFTSDVYVYEDVNGGWTIHVAGNRLTWLVPLPPHVDLTDDNFDTWYQRHRTVSMMLDDPTTHVREPIGLPHVGESFYNIPTPGECADKLVELRDLGYRVPEYAITELREEEAERVKTELAGP